MVGSQAGIGGSPPRAVCGSIDHVVPFHVSARVWNSSPTSELPTAAQKSMVTHDTLFREFDATPFSGLARTDHVVPSSHSMSGAVTSEFAR